jgi:MFS family permease
VAKGISQDNTGYVFAVNSVAYLICCLIFEKLFGQIPRKILFVGALAMAGASMFLFGPSYIIGIPDSYWFTVFSFFLLGII